MASSKASLRKQDTKVTGKVACGKGKAAKSGTTAARTLEIGKGASSMDRVRLSGEMG